MAKFEIGQKVWYKGKKWEIADRLDNTYALWKSKGSKEQIHELVSESELSIVRD